MNADVTPMNADHSRENLDALSRVVIGSAQRVSRSLGFGFLEKVYENSLMIDLEGSGLAVRQQEPVHVTYAGRIVGDYIPDLVVEGMMVVEIKALPALQASHRMQCVNYLRATGHRVCLLLNFGRPRLEVKRLVWHF